MRQDANRQLRTRAAFASLFIAFVAPSYAADDSEPEAEDADIEVVVTGTRTLQPVEDAPIATEVIARETIERSGAEDLAELLEEHPGIDLRRTVFGSSVRMQGLFPKHVLILVDGVRVLGAKGGEIDLSRFPVENIERVEIVKGPSSALYGSEAMAGVINIITRDAEEPFAARLRGRYGGNASLDAVGSVDLKTERVSSQIVGGYHSNAGYDLDPSNEATNASAFQWFDISHSTRVRATDTFQVQTSTSYLRRDLQGIDMSAAGAVFDRSNRIEDFRVTATPKWTPDARNALTVSGAYSVYKDQFLSDQRGSDALDKYEVTIERLGNLSVQYDRQLGQQHRLTAGLDGLSQFMQSDRLADGEGQRYRGAVFLQDQWAFPNTSRAFTLLPGMRVDSDSWFGLYTTPKMAVRVDALESLVLRAGYGWGYRAPDFKEMFIYFENPGVGYVVEGNPELRPETSKGAQVGLDWTPADWIGVSVNAFRNELTDLIAYATVEEAALGQPAVYQTVNIADATTQGVESMLSFDAGHTQLRIGHVLLEGTDNERDRALEGRARHRGTVRLNAEYEAWDLNWMTRAGMVGQRPYYLDTDGDGEEDTFYTDPFVTLDARVSKGLWSWAEVFLGADNMLGAGDATFVTIPPRRLYGGFSGTLGPFKQTQDEISTEQARSEP